MFGSSAGVTSPQTGAISDAINGRSVFEFGGSSGMGEAVARLAASSGARVVAGRSEERLSALSKELGASSAGYHCLDMSDEGEVRQALRSHGEVDHIVVTAADLTFKPLDQLENAEAETMLVAKFWGPLFVARAAKPVLREQGSLTLFSGVDAYRQTSETAVAGAL